VEHVDVRRRADDLLGARSKSRPSSRGPGVRVPPPFIFVAGWAAAWLLNRRLSLEIDGQGASAPQQLVGVLLLVAGLMLMGWALLTFSRARTAVIPIRPARVLVSSGPYRFSRNPMYVGLSAAYLGLAILLNQAWPILFLPGVIIVLLLVVIQREEQHLQDSFPDEYPAYRRSVRRWF
jgi:protein-S-isoprenylcysteine O-methyltransferase Ste14